MRDYERTEDRKERLRDVLTRRYSDLQLILEEIHNIHNISAILRTADGVGIQHVNLVYSAEEAFRFNPVVTQGVQKWLDLHWFDTIPRVINKLKKEGLKIYATGFSEEAVSFLEVDFTESCAIMLGNEHDGVSEIAQEQADQVIYIPMKGFVQSYNVSVATAIILAEARRQREANGLTGNLPEEVQEEYFQKWVKL